MFFNPINKVSRTGKILFSSDSLVKVILLCVELKSRYLIYVLVMIKQQKHNGKY